MLLVGLTHVFLMLCILWPAEFSVHAYVSRAVSPGGPSSALKDVPVVVTVNLRQSLNTITDHFIGHSLGYPCAISFSQQMGSKKLANVARALAPLYVRNGASYITSWGHHSANLVGRKRAISMETWETMCEFFRSVGWDHIPILAYKPRNPDGSWDPANTRKLLQYSADRNYSIAGFELGNELNHKANLSDPVQLAEDVATLQKVLGEFPEYRSSFIIGPDQARLDQYFYRFLAAGGAKHIRAASFHFYYFSGHHGNLTYFTDIEKMDALKRWIDNVYKMSRSVDPHLPVWLSETGSAGAGGVEGMTDRFASGFLWLDKLGVCASKGIPVVIRHIFYGDHYGIIDKDLNPNTDYWLTVLYKRIVRGAVFNATGRHDVHVYAACANTDNFKAGSLAVYMLNPNNYSVAFDLPQFNNQPRFRYSLTAGDHNGLTSKYISLNGARLQLVNDNLPSLKPESAPHGVVTVPAYSYTFLVFPEAQVSVCLN